MKMQPTTPDSRSPRSRRESTGPLRSAMRYRAGPCWTSGASKYFNTPSTPDVQHGPSRYAPGADGGRRQDSPSRSLPLSPLRIILVILFLGAYPAFVSISSCTSHDKDTASYSPGPVETGDSAETGDTSSSPDTSDSGDTGDTAQPRDTAIPEGRATYLVDASVVVGTIDSLNSVQGGPAPLNDGDADLTELYQQAGIPMVRIPVGDGSDYTLASIYPDIAADPYSPDSYHFDDIDRTMGAIVDAGLEPLWQAAFYLGNTDEWGYSCHHRGIAILDVDLWSIVIEHVLLHFNAGWADGYHWNVKWVETLNEPFKSWIYPRSSYLDVWYVYQAVAEAVARVNAATGSHIKVVGFANPVEPDSEGKYEWDSDTWLMDDFLSFVKTNDLPMDAFAFHSYEHPYDHQETALVVKEHLVKAGFGDIPLWNTEWNDSGLDLPTSSVWRSIYFGSQNAQTKTLWQGIVDRSFVFRGNQRTLPPHSEAECDDSRYIAADGTPQPAYYGWLMFDDMARDTPLRLEASTNRDEVTILAGISEDGNTLDVLLAYWIYYQDVDSYVDSDTDPYYVRVSGLSSDSTWTAELRTIDYDTTSYDPVNAVRLTTDPQGRLAIPGAIDLWTTHFWHLEKTD